MLTPPDELTPGLLSACLERDWEVRAASVSYRPVGFGSHHWEVAGDDGTRWFATADELHARQASAGEPLDRAFGRLAAALGAAASLRAAGLEFVVAPVPAASGEPVVRAAPGIALALYPFVAGQSFEWGGFSGPAHLRATVDLVAAVHAAPPSARGRARSDDYAVPHRDELERVLGGGAAGRGGEPGPFARPCAGLVREHEAAIRRLLARYDGLVASARSAPLRAVLTHGEPHPGNTMLTPAGWRLIDWDTALVAPPERDLWLLAAQDETALDRYAAAAGARPRPGLLELYRIRWDLADLAIDVGRLSRPHSGSEDDMASWDVLRALITRIGADDLDMMRSGVFPGELTD